ncbi:MAG TPA: U32 family peptidase [Desulfonatronum sp.]|nr:U32 family peptidase [Desulfonatronum sp.]
MPSFVPLPELLVPAGSLEKLRIALRYRADAVYLGGSAFNLRAGSSGLGWRELGRALDLARACNVRIYYCLNAFAAEGDLGPVREVLARLRQYPLDGVIVADPGVFHLTRQELPDIRIHVSTQANTGNSAAVAFWRELGAARVNLAREMNLREIRAVAAAVPGMELEVFVHGAMCLAISGRCSLSAYLNARSANRGQCTQPCRFHYRPVAMSLEEQLRPGEILWEVLEQEKFSAFFSPRDLCLVKYLPWLCRNRIAALKIEGRMRSGAYVALVCDVYRSALENMAQADIRPDLYLRELRGSLRRAMDTGFFLSGAPATASRRWDSLGTMPMVGQVTEKIGEEQWLVKVLDQWDASRPVELVLPGLRRPIIAPKAYRLENQLGESLSLAHPGVRAVLRLEQPGCAPDTFIRQVSNRGH